MSFPSTVRCLLFTRPLAVCAAALYLSLPLTPASAQDDDPSNGSAADPYGYGYGYYGDDGSGGGGYGDSSGQGCGVGYDSGDMGSGSYDHPYLDSDGDGLLDTEESALGTNPFSADTDEDGLSDYMEVYGYSIQRSTISSFPTTYYSYHLDPETGEDVMTSSEYFETFWYPEWICTSPLLADSDHDKLPDGYEYHNGLHPADPTDGWADADGDGLTRGDEYLLATNHLQADTDGDGYDDGLEVFLFGSNPLDPNDPPPPPPAATEPADDASSDPAGMTEPIDPSHPAPAADAPPPIDPTVPPPPPSDAAPEPTNNPPLAGSQTNSAPVPSPEPPPAAEWEPAPPTDPTSTPNPSAEAPSQPPPIRPVSSSTAFLALLTKDSNQNGVNDLAEILLGLDPAATNYPDSDNDGLDDIAEFKLGTNRFNPVTDGDGLLDGEEVRGRAMTNLYSYQYALLYPTYEYQTIYDEDGNILDIEYNAIYPSLPVYTSDPLKKDTDGDGYNDEWELRYGLDPSDPHDTYPWNENFAHATATWEWGDADGDGLPNGEEFLHRTDPFLADTDGDGLSDYDEVMGITFTPAPTWNAETGVYDPSGPITIYGNPRAFDSNGNGVGDFDEIQQAWNPLEGTAAPVPNHDLDSDQDGLTDLIETTVINPILKILGLPLFDPHNPADGLADWDGDGLSNAEEFALGTDFLNPDTDGDGFDDGGELFELFSDPLDPDDPAGFVEVEDPIHSAADGAPASNAAPSNAASQGSTATNGYVPPAGASGGSAAQAVIAGRVLTVPHPPANVSSSPTPPAPAEPDPETFLRGVISSVSGGSPPSKMEVDLEERIVETSEEKLEMEAEGWIEVAPIEDTANFSVIGWLMWRTTETGEDSPGTDYELHHPGGHEILIPGDEITADSSYGGVVSKLALHRDYEDQASEIHPHAELTDDQLPQGNWQRVWLSTRDGVPAPREIRRTYVFSSYPVPKENEGNGGSASGGSSSSSGTASGTGGNVKVGTVTFIIPAGGTRSTQVEKEGEAEGLQVAQNGSVQLAPQQGKGVGLSAQILVPKKGATSTGFQEHDLVATGRLKVAKWEDAFEGTSQNPSVKQNFNEGDIDRFYLKVPMPWKKGEGTASVKIKTDSDPENEIEVIEIPGEPGVFRSKGLILVADDVDDAYPPNTDEQLNDVTHKVKLGDKVTFTIAKPSVASLTVEARVPARGMTNVNLRTFNVQGTRTTEEIEASVKPILQAMYAQVGLRLNISVLALDWTIETGGAPGEMVLYEFNSEGELLKFHNDYATFCKTYRNSRIDQPFHLFFLRHAYPSAGVAVPRTKSSYIPPEHQLIFEQFLDNAFMNDAIAKGVRTPSHELLHLFVLHGNLDSEGHTSEYWNLLHRSGSISNVTGTKRISIEQEDEIYSHPFVKLVNN